MVPVRLRVGPVLPHRGPHYRVSGSVDKGRCRFRGQQGRLLSGDGVGSEPPVYIDPFMTHPELVVPGCSGQVLQEFLARIKGDDAGSFAVPLDYCLAVDQGKTPFDSWVATLEDLGNHFGGNVPKSLM